MFTKHGPAAVSDGVLKDELFSLITAEMDQAGYQAFSEYGEGWSDPTETVRRVLVEMLAGSDKRSRQKLFELLLSS